MWISRKRGSIGVTSLQPENHEYDVSDKQADVIFLDKVKREKNIVKGMISETKRSGVIRNFRTGVDPGCDDMENNTSGLIWNMMENKDNLSSMTFKLQNENGKLVTCDGPDFTFRSTIKRIYVLFEHWGYKVTQF